MIEIRISDKEMMACFRQGGLALEDHLRSLGFTTFEGYMEQPGLKMHATTVFHFHPTRRDLIFKRFDRWVPPWQNRAAILNRRFKL